MSTTIIEETVNITPSIHEYSTAIHTSYAIMVVPRAHLLVRWMLGWQRVLRGRGEPADIMVNILDIPVHLKWYSIPGKKFPSGESNPALGLERAIS